MHSLFVVYKECTIPTTIPDWLWGMLSGSRQDYTVHIYIYNYIAGSLPLHTRISHLNMYTQDNVCVVTSDVCVVTSDVCSD